jgi:antirestriction protein ArdC
MENQKISLAYQVVTDRITAMLEKGVAPWRKPWATSGLMPANFTTKREYSGINVWMLGCSEFSAPYWLTFKQALELGGSVKKGEKGTPVIFAKKMVFKDQDAEEGETSSKDRARLCMKYYTAFNVEQCDGIEWKDDSKRFEHNPIEKAEEIAKGYAGAPAVSYEGGRAFYRPSDDSITLPEKERFEKSEGYYSVLFHELSHSTGHQSRLNRDGVNSVSFGSDTYGKEELIAEMSSAYLCHAAGIECTVENSASYLAGWLAAIKHDAKLLVSAASQAQKSANFILGRV